MSIANNPTPSQPGLLMRAADETAADDAARREAVVAGFAAGAAADGFAMAGCCPARRSNSPSSLSTMSPASWPNWSLMRLRPFRSRNSNQPQASWRAHATCSAELKARVVPQVLSGDKIACLAITEPGGQFSQLRGTGQFATGYHFLLMAGPYQPADTVLCPAT